MVKVLIVDDSHIAREMIATILVTDPDVQVIGKVSNGREAINFMNNQAIKPDIITTDINMPVMNGFELIEHVMAYYPVPILIVTILNKEANFMRALNLGALDIIEKPPPSGWDQLPKVGIEIIEKVKLLSKVKVITHLRGKKSDSKPAVSGEVVIPKNSRRIVCIASSTGGPNTLLRFLKMFPRDFPVPFFIIQHMSEGFFITGLVEWFRSSLALMVEEASHHRLIQPGTVYISPIAKHLIVLPERMMLDDRPAVKNQKPSADVLF
ncbi:MAG: response regulator, partial [Candidatus Aureabacteria bacterium]|nr:response regulator [Candidatus Auribacterota bacterium]